MKSKTSMDFYREIELAATKAAPLFQMFGWTWHDIGVPKYTDIVNELSRLVDRALELEDGGTIGTGRLSVTVKHYDEESVLSIGLELVEAHEYGTSK